MSATISILKPGQGDLLRRLATQFKSKEPSEAKCRRMLEDEDLVVAAATVGEEAVGWAVAYVLPRFGKDIMHFYEIDVVASHRRQGIATKLIDALKEVCSERGLYKMFVLTNASNGPAMTLYERTGGTRANKDDVLFEYRGFEDRFTNR